MPLQDAYCRHDALRRVNIHRYYGVVSCAGTHRRSRLLLTPFKDHAALGPGLATTCEMSLLGPRFLCAYDSQKMASRESNMTVNS